MILIYQDYVHNTGALYQTLAQHFGAGEVSYVDANAVIAGALNQQIRAFFMPGGATRYVAAKLNGAGNAAIKHYVEQGGLYIGICAGAYYACRHTEWHPPHGDSIVVNNELAFFPATAHGPIVPFTRPDLGMEFTAARVNLFSSENKDMTVFYHGGPFFVTDDAYGYDVLAHYNDLTDHNIAVVTGTFGKGRYILSSPHIEVDSDQLQLQNFNVVANRLADIAAMPDSSFINTDYFKSLLNRFIG